MVFELARIKREPRLLPRLSGIDALGLSLPDK